MARPRARLLLGLLTAAVLMGNGCFQIAGYDDFSFQAPYQGRLLESRIERIDVLFVIDNSRDAFEKHAIMRETLDAFITQLVNPPCVKDEEEPVVQADPLAPCDEGYRRELPPVRDMHLGVISTSLGGHGSLDTCSGALSPTENDSAHLLARRAPGSAERVPTYQDIGFLAWDPDGQKTPPGEDDIDALITGMRDILGGVGAEGCGYEAPLEAWYRFLVDPEPYMELRLEGEEVVPHGIDEELLAQRAAFVRPDSLLVVVMLTDENDCSIIDGGENYLVVQRFQPDTTNPYHLPPPRAACAVHPFDPCCRSCAEPPGPGCSEAADQCAASLPAELDSVNLRCFDQKRRFGKDFLYPIERYVAGLTSPQITDRVGNPVDNALLAGRSPGRVVLAGIVGVPWQDIARIDAGGEPDLEDGLDVLGRTVGGVKSAAELLLPAGAHESAWAIMVGEPAQDVPPADPLMRESIDARAGDHPLWDQPLDEINGGEYSIPERDTLQYACIFKGKNCGEDPDCLAGRGQDCEDGSDCLQDLVCAPDLRCAEDCAAAEGACTCREPGDNPVCEDAAGGFSTYQYAESSYPGIRLLSALRGVGNAGVVGSICPFQVGDPSADDFGFKPALNGAIVDRVLASLQQHLCLDRTVFPDAGGVAPCVLIEARTEEPGPDCAAVCNGPGRRPATDAHSAAVDLARSDPDYATEAWGCFCEIIQAESASNREACQSYLGDPVVNKFGSSVDAWCYVDAASTPPLGAPELVAGCPADRRRIVRLAGGAEQAPDSRLFLYCN